MATLLETASLVMVPSGYEDGTLGSLVPTDASGDFTFTRGSNLSATRVNEQGHIEKGYENLLLQSNSFDISPWVKSNVSVTGGQAGYDGTNDAWLLQAVSSGYNRRVDQITSISGVSTYSFYAKANTSNYAQAIISNYSGADPNAYFNLSTGLAETNNDAVDVNMIDAGDGWYRCSITGNAEINQVRLLVSDYGYTNLVDAGGSIYIQNAMLNQGLTDYPYIETAAALEKGGILSDLPRLDYSSVRASLLLEPQRTNLITHSEYRNGGYQASVVNNSILSPEGVSNGCLFIENTALNAHGLQYSNMIGYNANPVNYTISVFAKAKERTAIRFLFYADTIGYNSSFFNISNGTTTGDSNTHKIQDYGNGWYRCSFTASVLNSTGGYNLASFLMSNGSASYYTGDGVSGLYMWGLQLEQDATYPTSYIPTYGTSQTRLAETATTSADATGDWTLYFEFDTTLLANYDRYLSGGFIQSLNIYIKDLWWRYNGVNRYFQNTEVNTIKILFRRTNGNIDAFYNGVEEFSDIASSATGVQDIVLLGGKHRQMLLFPTALSDEACIELTTL